MEHNKYWRKKNPHSGECLITGDYQPYPPTRMFDNLYFIGNTAMCCYLLETSEGLILLDCMDRGFYQYIEDSIRQLGFDPADVKAVLITHGHGDHYGDSNIFREKYGTKLYMSKIDEDFASSPDIPRPPHRPGLDYPMDGHIREGEDFTLGDTTIQFVDTPGHTPGCLSMLITVYDEGRAHKLALWGGTGSPRGMADRHVQLQSCDYFMTRCLQEGVTGELSNHPFTDNTIERLNVLRSIVDGTPHPFITGYEGFCRVMQMYREMYVDSLKKIK